MDYSAPPYEEWPSAQPHEVWAHARAHCPVIVGPGHEWNPAETITVTTFAPAEEVLRDSATFSASINGDAMGPFMGELMLGLDGDEHRQYRNLVAHAFRRSTLERWTEELIRPTIAQLLDDLEPAGRGDLVAGLTAQFPVQVILGIVGIPPQDCDRFNGWSDAINHGPLDPEAGLAASAAMGAYLEPLVADRRANPRDDMLSVLVHAEIDGERLSDARLSGFLKLLLPAGAETTFRVFGSCLLALLTHDDWYGRVCADRSLIPAVIEETLRWDTSVPLVMRVATTDTAIGSCPVMKGAPVSVLVGSASRDEQRCDDAQRWNPSREPVGHLAFGTGAHQCLGMHLARLELAVGLDAVLDRFPGLRLDPNEPEPLISGYAFRGPASLPVVWS